MFRKYLTTTTSMLISLPISFGAIAHNAYAEELEEIIVTAQKREQSLQDVPIAVAAFSGDFLDKFGIDNWDDMAIPGVQIGSGGRNENLFVRGIGSGTNFGFDQSVPVYIDGVYYGRARAENLGFLDTERIEVLKGPQPTYLGKNAIAGAVSITTRRPTKEFEGTVRASHEFGADETSLSAALSGPVSDKLRIRGAVKYRNMKGWMINVARENVRVPQVEEFAGRFSAELDISETAKVYFKYEHSTSRQEGRNRQLVNCGVVNTSQAALDTYLDLSVEDCTFNNTTTMNISQDVHPHVPIEEDFGFLKKLNYDGGEIIVDWDIGGYSLTSTTAYYELDFKIPQNDNDATSTEVGITSSFDLSDQFSQEFRLLSPSGRRLEWVAGLYYDKTDLAAGTIGDLFVPGPGTAAPALFQLATQNSESWAIFGEAGFKVSDPLTVKVGFRYNEVKKRSDLELISQMLVTTPGGVILLDQEFAPPGGQAIFPAFTFSDNRKDTKFQPSVIVEWRPNDDAMLYASWKKGFKAGGYDFDTLTVPPSGTLTFEPESVNSWEAGAKITFWDGRARINTAAFLSDYSDLQVSVFTGTIGFNTANAAKARTKGLEVDLTFAVSDDVTLTGDATWLDAKYRTFEGATCNAQQALVTPGCTQDLSGKHLQFAPTFSGNVGIAFDRETGSTMLGKNLNVSAQANVFFTSKFNTANAQDPLTVQSGFAKLDARIAVGAADGAWEFALVGRNLTNKKTTHWTDNAVLGPIASGLAYQKFYDRPREVAVELSLNF